VIRDIILGLLTTVTLFLFIQNGKLKIRIENVEHILIDAILLEVVKPKENENE